MIVNRGLLWFGRHWLLLTCLLWGGYAGLPWLAPIFMKLGWAPLGSAVYLIYSTQCHQLPERSFFLFGPQSMYSLADIQQVWPGAGDLLRLRQFVGDEQMGWKVAWSDRMVAMYTSVFVSSVAYGLLRRRLPALPAWGFFLISILPLGMDGGTHLLSDLAGIGHGFRDSNAWLALLTQHAWPVTFYAGDALGSFNSWMRLATGVSFGVGAVWFAYPYFDRSFGEAVRQANAEPLSLALDGAPELRL